MAETENPRRRRRKGPPKKTESYYKSAVKTFRHGFLDTEETTDFRLPTAAQMKREGAKPLTKSQAIAYIKDQGYSLGREIDWNPRTGTLTDIRRTGNLASGFDAESGFDLSKIDEWTPQQKAKVTRMFRVVTRLSSRPFQIYRARKPDNLLRVQKAAQHHAFPPELKVAFVPVGRPGEKAKIRVEKDRVTIHERGVTHSPILWEDLGLSMADVATDPKAAVLKAIEASGARRFTVLTGTTELRRTMPASELVEEVTRLMNTYDQIRVGPDGREREEWEYFLFGIQGYDVDTRQDLQEFKRAKDDARFAQEQFRRKAKRVFRRLYGSKKRSKKR